MAQFQDDEFSSSLLTSLDNQRKNERFTDFTIKISDASFACHKNILSATSPYFHAMLESEMIEACKDEVTIDSLMVKPSIMEQLLGYMYSGNITIDDENVKDIVHSSDFLLLARVKEKCSLLIKSALTVENCIGWYRFADNYSMPDLLCTIREMMQKRFIEVSQSEEFLSMTLSEIIEYIKDEKLNVRNEDVVVDACMKWVLHDLENRKEILKYLLKHLHLHYCTDEYLEYLLRKNFTLLLETENYQMLNKTRSLILNGTIEPTKGRCSYIPVQLVTLGGRKTNGEDNANCWAMNDTYLWNNILSIPGNQAKCFISVCTIPGGCFVTGGLLHGSPTNACFSLVRGIWEQRASMVFSRYGHGSVALGKHIYVLGGGDNVNANSVEMLNGMLFNWRSMAPMLHSVRYPIVANLELHIYVILTNARANKSVHEKNGIIIQKYNTVSNKWKIMSNLPARVTNTRGANASVVSGSMYLVGGVDKLCMQYMAEDDSWTFLSQPLHCHCYGACITYGDKVWLMGGMSDQIETSTSTDVIEEYDPSTNTWNTQCKLPQKGCYFHAIFMHIK